MILLLIYVISIGPAKIPVGRYLEWNGEIKASEILTTISVVISFSTLIVALWKEIQTRRSAEADRVRSAAAKTLSKLKRWKTLSLWYYEDIQPCFVETSELLVQEFDVEKARDHLWTVLTGARIKSAERILNESLENAYVELSSYYPNIFDVFTITLDNMNNIDEARYVDLLRLSQDSVLKYEQHREGYFAAKLGNDLRRSCALVKSLLHDQLSTVSKLIAHFLIGIIKQTDSEIISRKSKPMMLPLVPTNDFPNIFEHLKNAYEDAARSATPSPL